VQSRHEQARMGVSVRVIGNRLGLQSAKPVPPISTLNSLQPDPKLERGPHIAKVELLPASELNY
jgi:hypothetical protein